MQVKQKKKLHHAGQSVKKLYNAGQTKKKWHHAGQAIKKIASCRSSKKKLKNIKLQLNVIMYQHK